jgi:hypothetical protein
MINKDKKEYLRNSCNILVNNQAIIIAPMEYGPYQYFCVKTSLIREL